MLMAAIHNLIWYERDPEVRELLQYVLDVEVMRPDHVKALKVQGNAWYNFMWAAQKRLGPGSDGLHGVQAHMTNTLNTPVEVLEMNFPVRIRRYSLRPGSGGRGRYAGGDGIVREFEFLRPATVTLLTERRDLAPWGLNGGGDGERGRNLLNGRVLPAKTTREVGAGDRLRIETAGGGGWGRA